MGVWEVLALKKKFAALVVSAVVLVQASFSFFPASANAEEKSPDLKLEVQSAVLMDASSGQILYSLNADTPFPPASMAKMMTEYIVMENITSGKIKWEDLVNTSQYAADVIGSGQLIAKDEKLPVKDMFAAMSIYSANDATVALAEHIAGSEEDFAKIMNETAQKLGLSKDAHFINATGLSRADIGKYAPKSIDGETIITAKDAAIIAQHLVKEHKEILKYTGLPSKKLRESDKTPMINWNWMLEANQDNVNFKKYSYKGLDGLKTGHTAEAGYCFTGTAERNGMRLISVVMGTKTEPKRFEETGKLLDYGFTNFELKQVFGAQTEVDTLKTVDIKKGAKTKVPVVTETDFSIVVKKGTKDDQITKTTQQADASKLVAPIKKGDVLGKVTVSYNDKTYDVNLVAKEDVNKGSWIQLFFRSIKNFFVDLFSGIKNLI